MPISQESSVVDPFLVIRRMVIVSVVFWGVTGGLTYSSFQRHHVKVQEFIAENLDELRDLGRQDVVRQAVAACEQKCLSLTESDLAKMDEAWQKNASQDALAQAILHHPASRFLQGWLAGHPEWAEIFVTDREGRVAAMSNVTSDFLQADESWWQAARAAGVFIGNEEYDKSAGVWSYPVAVQLTDEQGEFLGVVKAVLKAGTLMTKDKD